MKKSRMTRFVSIIMVLAMLLPAAVAMADTINTEGKPVQAYYAKDGEAAYRLTVSGSYTNNGGWYEVPGAAGNVWVKRSDLVAMGAIAGVDASSEPTATSTSTGGSSATAGPTASPLPTITPPPASIGGSSDTDYEGTILHYTVGTDGLWLYDAVRGKAVKSVKSGEKLTLTTPVIRMEVVIVDDDTDEDGVLIDPYPTSKPVPEADWASLYYSGGTYYVPVEMLTVSESEDGKPNMNTASVVIGNANGAKYYEKLTSDGHVDTSSTVGGTIAVGTRVNARYATSAGHAFAFDVTRNEGGNVTKVTYYFSVDDIEAGSGSTAQVGSNADESLMVQITVKSMARLYTSTAFVEYMEVNTADFGGKSIYLYGMRIPVTSEENTKGFEYYKVTYNSTLYYVRDTDIGDFDLDHVGYNEGTKSETFWITVGTDGGYYYATAKRNEKNLEEGSAGYLAPGASRLASVHDSNWYTFVEDSDFSRAFYLHKSSLAGSVSTEQMSSVRAMVNDGAILYASMTELVDSGIRLSATYYTLRPINNSWYSIVYNNKQYYVKATDVQDDDATPVSSTTDGKTYTITIGMEGGTTYTDAALTKEYKTLRPGQRVTAKRYSSALYQVDVDGDGHYYFLPVTKIASILGGDDAAVIEEDLTEHEKAESVTGGEKDADFGETVLNYTVPAGGIWLYSAWQPTPKAAMVLNAGTKLQLTGVAGSDGWFTTWYGGKQYYINQNSMNANNSDLKTNTSYSVLVTGDIQFYDSYSASKGFGNKVDGSKFAPAVGSRINVKIAAFAAKARTTDPNVVAAYSTVYGGQTLYFAPTTADGGTVVSQDSILLATIGSSLDTNLITKLVMGSNFELNTTPDDRTKNIISVTVTNPDEGLILYGVRHDAYWYKVLYNDKVRYLHVDEFKDNKLMDAEQLSISDGAVSSTYTVVIGNGGADLYTLPKTNDRATTDADGNAVAIGEQNLYMRNGLKAGAVVRASKYDSSWYTYVDGTQVLYFRNNRVANENSNDAIGSRIVTITSPMPYYTTTTTNTAITSESRLPVGTYTFRTIDATWSSVFYAGRTYYVRNASFTATDLDSAIPVASTSVGNTYTITVGDPQNTGNEVLLYSTTKMATTVGSIAGGTKTKGTMMSVEYNGELTLIYEISYNGTNRYIFASDVYGVFEGDEVSEGKASEHEEETEGIGVGQSMYINLNAGTIIYESKATTSTYTVLATTGAYQVKKEDVNWYSIVYNGQTYYIPRTAIESPVGETEEDGDGSATGGANIPINTTFFETTKTIINLYAQPSTSAAITGTLLPGQMIQLTKISESWYEYDQPTGKTYIRGYELFGAAEIGEDTGTGTGGVTTDDKGGIVTATIRVSATSGTVNLRKKASTASDSTILERIPKDTVLTNLGYVVDANGKFWYNVSYNGKTGYVLGDYVSAIGTVGGTGTGGTGSTVDPSQDIGRTLTVDVSRVNIRSGAGTDQSIIGALERGAAVVPTGYKTGTDGMIWYSFRYSASQTGWIRYDYLSGGVASTAELSGNVAVKAGGTNLRSGAGEGFGVKAKLERDTLVTIIGTGTDTNNLLWYRVTVDGTNVTGYLRSDLVRQLTLAEQNKLQQSILGNYKELRSGATGDEVLALQQQLILIGYLAYGGADGKYGTNTTEAVTAFQRAHGLTANGVATPATQAAIFNTTVVTSGTTTTLDWFTSGGEALLEKNPNIQIYDISAKVTWNARFINGKNHADVIPATAADAQKLVSYSITGSYVRRPVLVTIGTQKYAGSMYAVGHGTTNYCSYFSGVMCIHFTNSRTHESNKVDADHQSAITQALQYANTSGN